jgi:hypothetical protein
VGARDAFGLGLAVAFRGGLRSRSHGGQGYLLGRPGRLPVADSVDLDSLTASAREAPGAFVELLATRRMAAGQITSEAS